MDNFIGEIRLFAFENPPEGWAPCDGQSLLIAAHSDLFAVIGTTYGGNGTDEFRLPDFMDKVPLGAGLGTGEGGVPLTKRAAGDTGGSESAAVSAAQMAPHTHSLRGCDAEATTAAPGGQLAAKGFWDSSGTGGVVGAYSSTPSPDATLAASALTVAGGDAPHPNMQPYLTLQFCIALQGIPPYAT